MLNLPLINFLEGADTRSSGARIAIFNISHDNLHEALVKELQETNVGIFTVFCMDGSLEFTLDDRIVRIKARTVCSFFTLSPFIINQSSPDFSGYLLFASSYYVTTIDSHIAITYFLHSFEQPLLTLSPSDIDYLLNLLRMAEIRTSDLDRVFSREIMYHIVMILIYELSAIYERNPRTDRKMIQSEILLREFLQLVNKYCEKEHNLNYYASKLSITPKHLSIKVKAITGHTAGEWIDYMIVLKIKKMLLNTSASLQQISDHFNFPDNSFFGKYFKRHTGMTPKSFRMQK